ncbi:MAG: nuclear transport factor 2 family protein [Endozoicomonas sp.]
MSKLNDQHIAAAMQAYVDAVSGDDVEKILELYSDDAIVEDPVGSEPHEGKDALRKFYQQAVDMVEAMELEGVVRAREKWGACAMRAYPKGANMVVQTLDVMVFNDDGLITKMTAYWGQGNLAPREP